MSEVLEYELLFIDTFSHENTEELNLDLVQFKRAVVIREVRIIPLGTQVTADVPGGRRLGATNPSSFKLDLFANNLTRPNAATFEKIGFLDYKDSDNIQFIPDVSIATDGLIIKGWYSAVTLAVYGSLTNVSKEKSPPPPPPPQPRKQTDQHQAPVTNMLTPQPWLMPDLSLAPPALHLVTIASAISASIQQHQQQQQTESKTVSVVGQADVGARKDGVAAAKGSTSQVEFNAKGEAKFPEDRPSDELFEEYLRKKDQQKAERERERQERERQERHRRESRSRSKDRSYSHGRSASCSASRSRSHTHSRSRSRSRSRSPSRRSSHDDYREHKERSGPEYRGTTERFKEGQPDKKRSDSHDRYDSRDRSRRNSGDERRDRSPDHVKSPRPKRSTSRERVIRDDAYHDRGDDKREYFEKDRDYRSRDSARDYNARDVRVDMSRGDGNREDWRPPAVMAGPPAMPPPGWPIPVADNNPIEIISIRDNRVPNWGGPPPPSETWARPPGWGAGRENWMEPPPGPGQYGMEVPECGSSVEPGEIEDPYVGGGGDGADGEETPTPGENLPLDEMYIGLSDGEIEDGDAYSDISSDENFLENLDTLSEWPLQDDTWTGILSAFNPYTCQFTNLDMYEEPHLTTYEIETRKYEDYKQVAQIPDEATQILETVNKFKDQPHQDRWIEGLENVLPMIPVGLAFLLQKTEHIVLDILIDWCFEGLDMNKAMAQPLVPFKLRHLKIGIRLAGILCSCNAQIALKLLARNIQHLLLDIFESDFMSSAVRLCVAKALDSTIRFKEGADWFAGKSYLQIDKDDHKKTCYQRLMEIMLNKQMARVAASLTPVMRKIHFVEVLSAVNAAVQEMTENSEELSRLALQASENVEDSEVESFRLPNLAPQALATLTNGLKAVQRALIDDNMGQPKHTLPTSKVFEVRSPPSASLPWVLNLLDATHFLECLFVLIASPATFHQPGVLQCVREVIQELLSSPEGLQFLCAKAEVTNGIIQCLTQTPGFPDDSEDSDGHIPKGPHPAHYLGLQMIYSLQTLQHIDSLQVYHSKVRGGTIPPTLDAAEPLGILHSLYLMTFTSQGCGAVLKVLSMGDHLEALLPFIKMAGEESQDIRIQRSVCHGYTVQLLLLLVRNTSNVTYLQLYGQHLLTFSKTEPQSTKTADKVSELYDWLSPLAQVPSFTYESTTFEELVKALKAYAEEITDFPRGLITVIRIMKYLCLAQEGDRDKQIELKYMYAQIGLYSADCLSLFITCLQKLSETLTRPFQHDLPPSPHQSLFIRQVVGGMLSLMKAIQSKLIEVRGAQFSDLTSLPCLFNIHTVLCSFSHTGSLSAELQHIQTTIVDILAAFTLAPEKQQTDEGLSKSLWTRMAKELLQFTLTAPYTYLSGLILFSELLPLPLPLQSHNALTVEDAKRVVQHRHLWSAHLHPLGAEVHNVIHTLAYSGSPPLQQLLRRVVWQLADLAHPTALLVTRSLLDTLNDGMDQAYEKAHPDIGNTETKQVEGEQKETEVKIKDEVSCSTETCKVLNLISFLINQPPIKMAFIALTVGKIGTPDEKYLQTLNRMAKLLNVTSDSPSHIQAQEYLMSIFQSLCDLELTLVPPDTSMTFIQQLANSLPSRDQMAIICEALLRHIDNRDHRFSSVLPALRTLALLMLHDFGFYFVKCALETVPTALYNLFVSINEQFSKDSSDCIATLSSAIELLQFLVALPEVPEGEEQTVPFERTYLISYKDLRDIMCWGKTSKEHHPLKELDKLLVEYAKEEESLKNVYESVNLVVSILKSDEDQDKPNMVEPVLPEVETLQSLFVMRQIYVLSYDEDDDRLSANYWLVTPMGDAELDYDPDIGVKCDLEEMARKCCQDFDLIGELEKGAVVSEPPVVKLRRRGKHGRRMIETINTSKMKDGRSRFVAPMRGRGFGRGLPVSRSDTFRNRAPNTSRPPSMHVDDFIKMELQGGLNIGPTGMNPALQSYRERLASSGQQGGNNRGGGNRGGSNMGNGRGRIMFFTPPGVSYNRRDVPRGGMFVSRGGGGMMGSRGGMMMMQRVGRLMPGNQMMSGGSPPKPPNWYGNRPTENWEFDRRQVMGNRDDMSMPPPNPGFNQNRGGVWGAGWRGRDTRRYMPPPANPNFYGGHRDRHQRAFTK